MIAWIEAGEPADAAEFHSATRDGATTQLGDDVAFTTPSGKSNCMTDSKYSGGALACLVDLTNPPPRPADAYGEWKGGWVDFDGTSVHVGSAHGDPGRFAAGTGPELPYGQSLAFGDYRCRSDQAGLFCVNYAHQSAARFSDAGVQPFGCLQPATAPPTGRLRCSAAEHGVVRRIGVHDHRAELRNGMGQFVFGVVGHACARRPGSADGSTSSSASASSW